MPTRRTSYDIVPLTPARWPDLERLFGSRGACGGCWCMWWRLPRAEFNAGKGAGNRRAFAALVRAGREPGLLAYADGEPVGWCAVAPRGEYVRLARSRTLQPLDDRPAWAVTCFFVAKEHRGRGLTVRLAREAVRFARARGARLVEGYPVDTGGAAQPAPFVYTGLPGTFRGAGFREAARRSRTRPIYRRALRGGAGS